MQHRLGIQRAFQRHQTCPKSPSKSAQSRHCKFWLKRVLTLSHFESSSSKANESNDAKLGHHMATHIVSMVAKTAIDLIKPISIQLTLTAAWPPWGLKVQGTCHLRHFLTPLKLHYSCSNLRPWPTRRWGKWCRNFQLAHNPVFWPLSISIHIGRFALQKGSASRENRFPTGTDLMTRSAKIICHAQGDIASCRLVQLGANLLLHRDAAGL